MANPDRERQAKAFGRNLKKLRAAAGLTQEALAEKSDLSAVYIRQIELGMRLPSVAVARSLRKGLNAQWDDLMGY